MSFNGNYKRYIQTGSDPKGGLLIVVFSLIIIWSFIIYLVS